ncbi:MAG: hypothetical protein WBZ01_17980 [Terriglobales bacterium]|jgi:uncharacterized repeat protein (TIGR01451 family)
MKRILMPATTLTTLKKIAFTLLCCSVLMVFGASAQTAQSVQAIKVDPGNNNPPPAGAILDLGGAYTTPPTAPTAIPGNGNETYQQYMVNFTAAAANSTCTNGSCSTVITFAFRDDPAQISFTNASVTDVTIPTTPSPNLLTNGSFGTGDLTGWTYVDSFGVSGAGLVGYSGEYIDNCPSFNGVVSYCWIDGAVQAYDALSQTIATTGGHTYQISFDVAENSGLIASAGAGGYPEGYPGSACYFALGGEAAGAVPPICYFSDLSTDNDIADAGGNGINVTAYALPTVPVATQQVPLTVTGAGGGSGTVSDITFNEFACTITDGSAATTGCSASYPINTAVTLTATPADDGVSTFGGWGGACATSGTTSPTGGICTVTMSMAQNVAAIFNQPGPTQAGTVTSTAPLVLGFNGGANVPACATEPSACGYDATGLLTNSNESPEALQVNAVTNLASGSPLTQAECSLILQATFPGAQCFVVLNGDGPGVDGPVLFAYTCPDSATDGTCGSLAQATFFATLGSDFYFSTGDNPGLAVIGTAPNQTLVSNSGGPPLVAMIKFVGAGPLDPCSLTSSPYVLTLSPTNQISSFTFVDGSPAAKPVKAPSGGTGSCWFVAYNVLSEAPTASISLPAGGQDFAQGSPQTATFTCNAVNNTLVSVGGQPAGAVGPYLTTSSCTLYDAYGTGSPASYPGTTPPTNTTSGTNTTTNTVAIDTSTVGPHTLTATVVDSATNTVSSSTVSYTVVAATDVAIANVAASTANTGSKLTYLIGVGDWGPANAYNVVVTDTLATGTTFVSASGTNEGCQVVNKKLTCSSTPVACALRNGVVSCNVGTLMPLSLSDINGAVITVTVSVTATGTTKNPAILTNTATVGESNTNTKPSNASSTATTKVY